MAKANTSVAVGGLILAAGDIEYNTHAESVTCKVRNTADRPVQVGSHYHFFEVNQQLEFDRGLAFGKRLDIPATTGIRFEPGDEMEVTLIPYGGNQRAVGFNNLVDGWTGGEGSFSPNYIRAMKRVGLMGIKNKK